MNHKMKQIETSLLNNGLLWFEFSWMAREFGGLILLIIGLIEFMTSIILFATEDDTAKRIKYALVLCGILLFDSFAMHMPFTEQELSMANEFDHVLTNLGVGAGLLMVVGLREYHKD